jgi:hypothetical protein
LIAIRSVYQTSAQTIKKAIARNFVQLTAERSRQRQTFLADVDDTVFRFSARLRGSRRLYPCSEVEKFHIVSKSKIKELQNIQALLRQELSADRMPDGGELRRL